MTTQHSVGSRILSARKYARLSQAELAEMAGFERTALSRYENGDEVPIRRLGAIALALRLPISHFDPSLANLIDQSEIGEPKGTYRARRSSGGIHLANQADAPILLDVLSVPLSRSHLSSLETLAKGIRAEQQEQEATASSKH